MSDTRKPTRADLIRRRRAQRQTATKTTLHPAPPPIAPAPRRTFGVESRTARPPFTRMPVMGGTARQVGQVARRQYTSTLTLSESPTLALPRLHAGRLVSGALTLTLAFLLYTLWNAPTFQVRGAEVYGNQRLGVTEINAALRLIGQPIFKAVPAQLEANLRTDYPDLAQVKVEVGLPNRLIVHVVERTPIITWHQGEQTFWIDAEGVAFPVRGEAAALIEVFANGRPPQVASAADQTAGPPVFIDPALVRVMATVFPYVPPGQPMVYDPAYGVGWKDPRGWSVYFGQNTTDIPLKLQIYQAIVDKLVASGIVPTLISVEHLRAPFYK